MQFARPGFLLRFPPLLLLLALFALPSPASAKNLPDPASGCALNVPDDWTATSQPLPSGYSVAAVKSDKTKAVTLFVQPVSPGASVDDNSDLIKGIEGGFLKSGGKIVSHEHKTLKGISFYVMTGTSTGPKGTVQSTAWITVSNGNMYQLCLYDLNGDPAKDADLTAAINSFALLAK